MQSRDELIRAFDKLGVFLQCEIEKDQSDWFDDISRRVFIKNGWFDPRETKTALTYWAGALDSKNLKAWLSDSEFSISPMKVGLILAGNIPMVGFHDVLTTILCGHRALLKCSSNDNVLIPELLHIASRFCDGFNDSFEIIDRLKDYDAAIATGSNNSKRYFNSYFSHVPNIIRGNKTGIAVMNGTESKKDLNGLMKDCFTYFGLGCRNITKLYLPKDYELNEIFEASVPFSYLMNNNKYANNYTYHKALMMMEKQPVLENELILMIPNPSLFSPVSVLNYEYYNNEDELTEMIEQNLDKIQCVVGHNNRDFGTAQLPSLDDYADGVDTLKFLSNLHSERLPN